MLGDIEYPVSLFFFLFESWFLAKDGIELMRVGSELHKPGGQDNVDFLSFLHFVEGSTTPVGFIWEGEVR